MRKNQSPPSPATSIDQLEAEVSELLEAIEAETRSLRPRILAGEDSAPVRKRIGALEDKIAAAKAQIDELIGQRDAQFADDVARDTADIAGRLATDIAARLAALEPAPQPSK
jgi:Mg-chelatase subunit ChlI